MKITISILIILSAVVALMSMMFKAISYNLHSMHNKSSTFECGFDLMSNLRLPFSLNFYIISIIFLIFDVELILLLPFVFMVKLTLSMSTYIVLTMFFIILILGFVYEWWMGLLNWII